MLTAVVCSFYSEHTRAGSVDPRQLRMTTPFVKSSSRHLCAFSLPVSQICGKVYINSPKTVSLSFLKPLHKTIFCYNASIGAMEIKLLFRGAAGSGDARHGATAPSLCMWDRSYPTAPLCLRREGRVDGLDGKVGASVRGPTPHPPPSVPVLCPTCVLVPFFVFCLSYKSLEMGCSLQGAARLDLSYCSAL